MPTHNEKKPNGSTSPGGNGAAHSSSGVSAQGVLGDIQQRVTSRVDEQKNRAADGLGGIADVFRQASHELRNENETLASYVDMASDELRRFAAQVRERGVEDMMDGVNRFARRRPALFIGGAFLLGVGLARFLKSSAETGSEREYGSGFSSVDPMTASTGSPSYSGRLRQASARQGEAGDY